MHAEQVLLNTHRPGFADVWRQRQLHLDSLLAVWLHAAAAAAAQKGLPYVRERSIMSVSMPNAWNFAWDHALFVQVGVWPVC